MQLAGVETGVKRC